MPQMPFFDYFVDMRECKCGHAYLVHVEEFGCMMSRKNLFKKRGQCGCKSFNLNVIYMDDVKK